MENDNFYVTICPRARTGEFKEGDYTHMLSMLDPDERYDDIVIPNRTQLQGRLVFHDLDDIEVRNPQYCTYIHPKKEHVLQIMEFFQHVRAQRGSGVLIHCEAGIARSTAAAMIGLCALGIRPEDSFQHVVQLVEMALPNRRMLRMADEILNAPVKLAQLAEQRRKELYSMYGQADPLELLREELEKKSAATLQKEKFQYWSKYCMRYLRSLMKAKKRPPKPSCFLKQIAPAHF